MSQSKIHHPHTDLGIIKIRSFKLSCFVKSLLIIWFIKARATKSLTIMLKLAT